MLKLFLVGGAVRDKLLGREPKDLDFVVVGATEADLLAAFPDAQKQGAAFPVYRVEGFGEIALARRERKVGEGHTGFEVEFGPEVTLEEDLSRRDLTINAMAMNMATSEIVDPFNGRGDLSLRLLRHVSPAFADDPLRVYRVARFAAQLGFSVAAETTALMRTLMGELHTLSAERVCEELRKALRSQHPHLFFQELEAAGVLCIHFPELDALTYIPAGPHKYHQEANAFVHTMLVLDEAVSHGANELERFAALVHDLGKGTTPAHMLPAHHGHEERGVELVEAMGARLKLPVDFIQAGTLASREHLLVHRFMTLRPNTKVDLVARAERNPLRPEGLALVTLADALGRVPSRGAEGPGGLRRAAEVYRSITARGLGLPNATCTGPAVGARLREARIQAVREALPRKEDE